jgi:hypothetical protein
MGGWADGGWVNKQLRKSELGELGLGFQGGM